MNDPAIIAYIAILLGAVCGVLVPYILKAIEDGRKFDIAYLYTMVFTLIASAFAVLPENPETMMSFRGLFSLFLAGAGLQLSLNKVTTLIRRRSGRVEEIEGG